MTKLRFAVVISHPTQHHAPFFRELAQVADLQVKVFYCCDWGVQPTTDPGFGTKFAWDVPLLEGYDHEFLPLPRRPRKMNFWEIDNPTVGQRLADFAPHALWVHGYGHRSCWRAARWARGRCAVLHFGDSELLHPRPWYVRLAKAALIPWYFRYCDAFVTIGDQNESYYAHYGVPRARMFRGAYPVDIRRFEQTLAAPDRPPRATLRQRFGLPADGVVALFAAKMIPRKRPRDLIEATALLSRKQVPLWSLMVGDGPLRAELEDDVRQRGLTERVRFSGFVNQKEIPLVLDCADILAMTSEEDAHPLAVSESLSVGHAIVASDRVGCVGPTDAARPGFNTLTYRCGNVAALAEQLEHLVREPERRRSMGLASRQLAREQDLGVLVRAVLKALAALRPEFQTLWRELSPELFSRLSEQARVLDSRSAGQADWGRQYSPA